MPPAPPQVTQLSWAKFNWTPSFETDDFVNTFTDAVAAGLKRLGSNGAYALMQIPSESTTIQAPNEGQVDFRLANATAHFLPSVQWRQPQAMTVVDGNLQIDFSRALFQTALTLQNNQLGHQSIQANGQILASGAMKATGGDAAILGAVTTDGKEAGYAFQKLLPSQGELRGVTLWGR